MRLGEAEAHRAQPERRIGRDARESVEPFLVLVGAEIEGADGDRLAVHALGDAAVGLELLVLGGQAVAVEEQELGAEQADPARAVLERLRRGRRAARCWRRARRARRRASSAGLVRRRLSFWRSSSSSLCFSRYSASTARSGLTITTCWLPSTISISPSRMSCARVVRGDHRGHVEAARDDGRVRRHAAEVGEERREVVLLELDHVGRREVVRDEDRLLLGGGRAAPRRACPSVASARARRPGPRRPCARAGRGPRSGRTARRSTPICWVSAHSALQRCSAMMLLRRLGERGVLEDHPVHVEERAELARARRPMVIAECRPSSSFWTSCTAAVEALDLRGHLARGDRVVRDLERRVRDELRTADGDAARDADAVQGEAHVHRFMGRGVHDWFRLLRIRHEAFMLARPRHWPSPK